MGLGEKTEEQNLLKESLTDQRQIILFNDEFNTFDHVIDMLIDICEHTPEQAEQCAMLVHYKGKCSVKKGSLDKIKPMCSALLDAGLSAEIQ